MAYLVQVDTREMKWPSSTRALRRAFKSKTSDLIELITTDGAIESLAEFWCKRGRGEVVGVECYQSRVRVITIKIADEVPKRDAAPPCEVWERVNTGSRSLQIGGA